MPEWDAAMNRNCDAVRQKLSETAHVLDHDSDRWKMPSDRQGHLL